MRRYYAAYESQVATDEPDELELEPRIKTFERTTGTGLWTDHV